MYITVLCSQRHSTDASPLRHNAIMQMGNYATKLKWTRIFKRDVISIDICPQ